MFQNYSSWGVKQLRHSYPVSHLDWEFLCSCWIPGTFRLLHSKGRAAFYRLWKISWTQRCRPWQWGSLCSILDIYGLRDGVGTDSKCYNCHNIIHMSFQDIWRFRLHTTMCNFWNIHSKYVLDMNAMSYKLKHKK